MNIEKADQTPDDGNCTASDLVVDALRANGVDVVFGLPGEENLPLVSAMRRAGLRLVVCRHEQHAGFMAVAHARLTGRPGVCLATLGPGALNLFTPLAQAYLMGVPLLALTGQKAQTDNREGSFQVVDVVGAASPIVAASMTIRDPATAAEAMADAFRRASTPPRGPVLVELPEDVAAAPVRRHAAQPIDVAVPVASDEVVDRLGSRIALARRPVVLAGIRATNPEVSSALRHLAATSGLAVLTTQMGKGAIAETDARSLRCLGIHRRDHVHLALDQADLVVAVGYQPVEHPPLAWQQDRDLPIVHVDDAPSAREPGYEPEFDVVGDPAALLRRLADSGLEVDSGWSVEARHQINHLLTSEHGDGESVDPLIVVRTVADQQRIGDVVALDNGVFKIWFARHYPALEPTSLLLDNATASMGAGLATATAAAWLGHRALAVVGDGGLMMNVGDLETVVRLGVDLTVLVLRDDAYGFIAWHQDEQDRARHGVELTNPDLVKLVESFGGVGRSVRTVEELGPVLAEARESEGLTLVDCVIDYSINDLL